MENMLSYLVQQCITKNVTTRFGTVLETFNQNQLICLQVHIFARVFSNDFYVNFAIFFYSFLCQRARFLRRADFAKAVGPTDMTGKF